MNRVAKTQRRGSENQRPGDGEQADPCLQPIRQKAGLRSLRLGPRADGKSQSRRQAVATAAQLQHGPDLFQSRSDAHGSGRLREKRSCDQREQGSGRGRARQKARSEALIHLSAAYNEKAEWQRKEKVSFGNKHGVGHYINREGHNDYDDGQQTKRGVFLN